MFGIGPLEVIILLGLAGVFIATPIIVILVILYVAKKNKPQFDDNLKDKS
jgi:predicted PurR-regulated permease PerM